MLKPDDSVNNPPVADCAAPAEVDPAVTVTAPPAPQVPAPTETEIAPPPPPVATPDPISIAPELLAVVVPVLNTNLPL